MAQESDSLTDADVGVLLRLIVKKPLCEDLRDYKTDVLGGLALIVGADAWTWALQSLDADNLDATFVAILDGGWESDEQRVACITGALSDAIKDVVRPSIYPEHRTYTRSDLLTDGEWYASEFYLKHREPTRLDDFLLSVYPVNRDLQSTVRLHRRRGRPPFGGRERRIVHVVTGALDSLHASNLALEGFPPLRGLSRRAREVLALLIQGYSKKQVAVVLALSEHTVNDYLKELHRRFHVHSRGELLAQFIAPGLVPLQVASSSSSASRSHQILMILLLPCLLAECESTRAEGSLSLRASGCKARNGAEELSPACRQAQQTLEMALRNATGPASRSQIPRYRPGLPARRRDARAGRTCSQAARE